MADERAYFQSLIRGIVLRHFHRKQNCAAREIAEFWAGRDLEDHEVDYGGFSRKMNGSRGWLFEDVLALISITGSARILDAMRERGRCEALPGDALHILAAMASKEGGEGVAAALDERDLQKAFTEAEEAELAFRNLKLRIKAQIEEEGA